MLVKLMGISGKVTARTYQDVIPQRLKFLISMSEIEINRLEPELGQDITGSSDSFPHGTGYFLL